MEVETMTEPQPLEQEPVITEEQASEALKANDVKTVRGWYDQQQAQADKEPDGEGRTMVLYLLGRMQVKAGLFKDGLESLDSAKVNAENLYEATWVATIEKAISDAIEATA